MSYLVARRRTKSTDAAAGTDTPTNTLGDKIATFVTFFKLV